MTSHLLRVLLGGGREPAPSVYVEPPPDHDFQADAAGLIRVGSDPGRSSTRQLHGALVDGSLDNFVYLAYGATLATYVDWYLNGVLVRSDDTRPFDFEGDVGGVPIDLRAIPDGAVTIQCTYLLENGTAFDIKAQFTMQNSTDPGNPDPGVAAPGNIREKIGAGLGQRTGDALASYGGWLTRGGQRLPIQLAFLPSKDAHVAPDPDGVRRLTWAKLPGAFQSLLKRGSGGAAYAGGQMREITVVISMMLCRVGETLESHSKGENAEAVAAITAMAQWAAANGWSGTYPNGMPKFMIQMGWESNMAWPPWTYFPKDSPNATLAGYFKGAFDRYGKIWHDNCPGMMLGHGVNPGHGPISIITTAHPDESDYIVFDIYDRFGGYNATDTQAQRNTKWVNSARNEKLTGKDIASDGFHRPGFNDILAFAKAKGKKLLMGEAACWGLLSDAGRANPNYPIFMGEMLQTMHDEDVCLGGMYFEQDYDGGAHELRGTGAADGKPTQPVGSNFTVAAAKAWLDTAAPLRNYSEIGSIDAATTLRLPWKWSPVAGRLAVLVIRTGGKVPTPTGGWTLQRQSLLVDELGLYVYTKVLTGLEGSEFVITTATPTTIDAWVGEFANAAVVADVANVVASSNGVTQQDLSPSTITVLANDLEFHVVATRDPSGNNFRVSPTYCISNRKGARLAVYTSPMVDALRATRTHKWTTSTRAMVASMRLRDSAGGVVS